MVSDKQELWFLEEYKNFTAAMLEINRLMWTRFNIFLGVNTALIAAWVLLFKVLSSLRLIARILLAVNFRLTD